MFRLWEKCKIYLSFISFALIVLIFEMVKLEEGKESFTWGKHQRNIENKMTSGKVFPSFSHAYS